MEKPEPGSAAAEPRKGSTAATVLLLTACLAVWPAVFACVVVATFVGVAVYFDDPGGPLFWPLAWIGSAITYALAVGLPTAICARRRHWYVRLIPAVIVAAPIIWLIILAGVWALPGALTIAVSIAVETTGLRHQWTVRTWTWLITRLAPRRHQSLNIDQNRI